MANSTAQRHQVLRLQQLGTAPTTADETARTIELVVATESPVDGLVLRCQAGAVEYGPAPVPVLLDHQNQTGLMAGRLLSIRFERGQLVAVAQFTDAPAAEEGWQLARAGCAVSVGATFNADAIEPGRGGSPDVVSSWRLREASLVAVGADPMATTRSAPDLKTNPALEGMTMSDTTQTTIDREEQALDRIERRRCTGILDAARKLEVPEAVALDLIERGVPLDEARGQLIDARSAAERRTPGIAHSYDPSREFGDGLERTRTSIWSQPNNGPRRTDALAELVQRHWSGKAGQPLDYSLRQLGITGSNAVEVVSRALSTTDLPLALLGSGNRQLLAQFAAAPQGVRNAANIRVFADYRGGSTLDVGLVGKAQPIGEGGEVKFGNASEQAASYKPVRHGLGLKFTPESLANDDLAGLDRAISELGAAMLEAEAEALAALLEGNALGALAPDGKRLFHADHANTVAGPLGIGTLGEAVSKLRRQTTIGGRFLYMEPGAILCSPDIELTVRQLLSDTLQAAEPANVNPWRDLEVAVDPQLGQEFVYMLPAGARRPLELGRLTPAPVLESETHFDTGMFKVKSEHAFGCAVVDHRPIVRLAVAGS